MLYYSMLYFVLTASDILDCQSPDSSSSFPARATEYRSRRKGSLLYTTDSDWEELNVSRDTRLYISLMYVQKTKQKCSKDDSEILSINCKKCLSRGVVL